jgi:hypothetical protein
MTRLRLRPTLVVLGLVVIGCGAIAARPAAPSGQTTVHEWGTFTSVAGEDGQAIEWLPLSGPSDLPCFVRRMPVSPKSWHPGGVAGTPGTVRMETPVLYFYADQPADLRVSVRFPYGLVTEWFPEATVAPLFPPRYLRDVTATASWHVGVRPQARMAFPTEGEASHYYAARATDASPVQVGGQFEKFLFYRGIASFPVPVTARVTPSGGVRAENTSAHAFARLILFERRNGKIGYRVSAGPRGVATFDAPVLTATVDSLRADLVDILTGEGLYRREAEAMVETWRDSWFEEGTRLFYVLSRAAVDTILPLEIDPEPGAMARVFVGRVEVITPAMLANVERAIGAGDLRALHQYGRVLQPITDRLLYAASPRVSADRVRTLLQQVAASHQPERPCGG